MDAIRVGLYFSAGFEQARVPKLWLVLNQLVGLLFSQKQKITIKHSEIIMQLLWQAQ